MMNKANNHTYITKRYSLILTLVVVMTGSEAFAFGVYSGIYGNEYAKQFVKAYGGMIDSGEKRGKVSVKNNSDIDVSVDAHVVKVEREWTSDDLGHEYIGYKKHSGFYNLEAHIENKHPTITYPVFSATVISGKKATLGTLSSANLGHNKDQWMRVYAVQIRDKNNPARATMYCYEIPKYLSDGLNYGQIISQVNSIDFNHLGSDLKQENVKGPYTNLRITVARDKDGFLISPALEKNKFFRYVIKQQPKKDGGNYLVKAERTSS